METIICKKGCCSLQIFPKTKPENISQHYPFEKRKAGVLVCNGNEVLLTQSYNNCWGIPKGQMELYDQSTKICAERELKEETGLDITLNEKDLYKILLDNCYVYKINLENKNLVKLENLPQLDSTGIGWVNIECAFDFNLNFLTRKILMGI
ncbi:hydrolase, NUDIX family [Invertebrate iridescent virus 22]|uniref:Hydrolase, NUDIX family n=1 Tax=Invertebrate iridescent virus 22 TaxID=345198 RepID=W8W2P1_9VIRU|nr:hydrolase, NUDIX family [Invertebrate iridescent virus 22]CCV01879.1 hydrolase, NUDIX family [Invertebrate iridescent virus 22]